MTTNGEIAQGFPHDDECEQLQPFRDGDDPLHPTRDQMCGCGLRDMVMLRAVCGDAWANVIEIALMGHKPIVSWVD